MKRNILFVLMFVVAIICSGCYNGKKLDEQYAARQEGISKRNVSTAIPSTATNVIYHGNGWHTFELDGNKFLGRYQKHGSYGVQCITQIK